MPLDINASHISGEAHVYLPAVGTPRPANPFVVPSATAFPEIGHTSYDDGLTISPSISTDVKKTHQSPSGARQVVTDYTVEISVILEQINLPTLALFFGAGGAQSDGSYWIPRSPAPVETGLYIRSLDGDAVLPILVPRASVIADGDMVLKPGEFTPLPVKFTVLDLASAPGLAQLLGVGVTSLAVSPSTATIDVSDASTAQLVVTSTFTDASTKIVTPYATYTSSDPTKATVSPSGLVAPVAPGSVSITAKYGGVTQTSAITVTA